MGSDENMYATTSHAMFQLISASLSIENSSNIYRQNLLLNLLFSNVTISDSAISEINAIESSIKTTSSIMQIINSSISNVSNYDDYQFIFVTLDSTIIINSLNFSNSESNLLNIVDAE